MTYQQTLEYLYQQLPMYQRVGAQAFKKDLTNTINLCEALDNPHHKFPSIHIAGTNGKGSTVEIAGVIADHAGLSYGQYTSPHIHRIHERIRINGQLLDAASGNHIWAERFDGDVVIFAILYDVGPLQINIAFHLIDHRFVLCTVLHQLFDMVFGPIRYTDCTDPSHFVVSFEYPPGS